MKKEINTYNGTIWIFRVILMALCLVSLVANLRKVYYFGQEFVFRYKTFIYNSDLNGDYEKAFRCGIMVFSCICLLLYLIAWRYAARGRRDGAVIDIATTVAVLVLPVAGLIITGSVQRSAIQTEYLFWLAIRCVFIIIALSMQVKEYVRNQKLWEQDTPKIAVPAIAAVLAAAALFLVLVLQVNSKYRYMFKVYESVEHSLKTEQAENILNYPAVTFSEESVYYIDNYRNLKRVKTDNVTEELFTATKESEGAKYINSIDYYDGYIYVAAENSEGTSLGRIDANSGSLEELIKDSDIKSDIYSAAVRDGYVYYLASSKNDDRSWIYNVYRYNISDKSNELYLGNLIIHAGSDENDRDYNFYAKIICDDKDYFEKDVNDEVTGEKTKTKDGFITIKKGDLTEGFVLVKYDGETEKVIADHVQCYATDDKYIYYIESKEVSGDSCEVSLNRMSPAGENQEEIMTYASVYLPDMDYGKTKRCRIYSCEDKLLVKYYTMLENGQSREAVYDYIKTE